MSIYRLMRDEPPPRAKRDKLAADDWEQPMRGHEAQPATRASIADTLTRYVPSEAVALYTAVLPFLVSSSEPLDAQDYSVRWIVVAVIAVIAELYAVGLYLRERHADGLAGRARTAIGRCFVVLIAFLAWVCVVPGSSFGTFSWYTPSRGALIGLLAGGLLAAVSYVANA